MPDNEKIIAKLQDAAAYFRSGFDAMYGTVACEKYLSWTDAIEQAIALLKAQEPRVMQISEIMEIYKADPLHVWPYNTPPYLYIQEHPHVRNSSESWAAWREIRYIIEGELFGHTAQSYGKTWRCWTSRPTDEQREAIPWE